MNSNIYLVFIDDISKFSWVYLLKFKFDVFNIFKYFKATIENQLNRKIKIFRSNGGGGFSSNAFTDFCSSQGIIHEFSYPRNPQTKWGGYEKAQKLLWVLSHDVI